MNSKSKIDKFFQDNWTETPVQYEGAFFDVPIDNRWISISFVPFDRGIIGIGGSNRRTENQGIIVVRTYETSPTLALDLTQKVFAFLDCKNINDIIVDMGVPDGNGAIPLHNGIFEMTLNFKTRNYNT